MASDTYRPGFQFIGDRLCLDFINTQVVEAGRPMDLLEDFGGLAAWCVAARIITEQQSEALIKNWGGAPATDQAFGLARRLRAALRVMAERSVLGEAIPQCAIAVVNEVLREWRGYFEVAYAGEGYAKRFHPSLSQPVDLLLPIADSAADLLSAGDLAQIKQCSNPACVLYYYDTTRNRARRWCSMSTCGNRAKVGAYYRRKRQAAG